MSNKLWRVDPEDCGCTDCAVGKSKPINYCTDEELFWLYFGIIENASGYEVKVEYSITYKD